MPIIYQWLVFPLANILKSGCLQFLGKIFRSILVTQEFKCPVEHFLKVLQNLSLPPISLNTEFLNALCSQQLLLQPKMRILLKRLRKGDIHYILSPGLQLSGKKKNKSNTPNKDIHAQHKLSLKFQCFKILESVSMLLMPFGGIFIYKPDYNYCHLGKIHSTVILMPTIAVRCTSSRQQRV